MKLTTAILTGAICLVFAGGASADVTINITGSTAFRSVIHNTVLAVMTGETYAYTGTSYTGANQAIIKGTVAGISGTTTVRTSWSGSATGIKDVAQANTINFLPTNTATSAGGTADVPTGTDPATAKFAMSDVFQTSTIYTSPALTNANVAVIPFIFCVNNGAPANLTNVTDQLMQALYSSAFLPLSLFTGDAADGKLVYGTGRDSGSGTRITVLAETGYGIFKPVSQWMGTAAAGAISTLQFWPTTGSGADPSVAGNGGYTSGSSIRSLLPNTSTNVTVLDQNGNDVYGTPQDLLVLAWLGENDALTAQTNGAKLLTYNGVTFTQDNIRNGEYTLWGYEHMYTTSGLSADENAFRTAMINAIPANLAGGGIAISTMKVSRGSDGGLVGP